MALGDPILINLASATFLLSAETGCIIQSSERDVDSKLKEVFNAAAGYTSGYVFYDFKASSSWSAIVNGTSGLAIAAPGVAITLANDLGIGTNKNGVSSGGIYTTSVKISHQGEDLRMISGQAVQRQNIS
jgi:hypothetical protein